MERLKLVALDEADLEVIAACLQDAVFKTGDMAFSKSAHGFAIEANRFVWEGGKEADGKTWERRRALLSLRRVQAVRSRGIDLANKDTVHSLLTIQFVADDEAPRGAIELVLAGGASVVLEVECIEVQLADVGGAWGTEFRPRHPLSD
ncbi:hypothetical protein DFR52_10358 [Hoeflea marina]|uniref:DUF2948 family protein n=1 Tax=Hoeflea marina TaxID=274592 RepID=A0A317PMZ1_9HYPH|nr:DUF2948 family protein [Hoeflea marina]PWV99860.1 hypothetical protein DFR52_10358 [Hoeflea marina]